MFIKFNYSHALLALLLAASSCNSNNKIEREGEPTIYTTAADDPEMNAATTKGRATFPRFLAILASHDSTITNPAIKVHYDDGQESEYIWLTDPVMENGQLYGIVGNEPEFTKQVAAGQRVVIDTTTVGDWSYLQGNRLIGGYTIKLLRSRMPPAERAEFDESTGWQFE
jgi:uncharacterized protein YegJ (DUF2314 family)